MRRLLITAIVPLLGAIPLASGAKAQEDSETFCARYAQTAVEMVAQQHNNGFGLETRFPDRYTPYYEDHYDWCMSLEDFDIARREEEHRLDDISAAFLCNRYANRAMEQLAEAFAQCGNTPVSGAHWSVTEFGGHYAWCLQQKTNPDGSIGFRTNPGMDEARNLRQADLDRC